MAKLIAVIDDDPAFQTLMQEFLHWEEGYEVLPLYQEENAFERVRRVLPDAVILGVQVAHRNGGWQTLEAVRRDPALHEVAVIVCTTDGRMIQEHAADLRRYKADVLLKPFRLEELFSVLYQVIGPSEPALGG